VTDRLRALWDFGDLDATEHRFRGALAGEESDAGRAEVLTQLARVEGLRNRFDEAERLIQEAEALAREGATAAHIRVDLERGRVRRASCDDEGALPLFESAFEQAVETGELFLAADAAHMAALTAPSREEFVRWTNRGIDVAEDAEPAVRYWLGPLLNNLGWEQYDAGEHEAALKSFERALAERERDPGNAEPIALARYAVAKALRALGRPAEAIPLAESAVEWSGSAGTPDGWYHAELAEAYAAVGRQAEAALHAERALSLLRDVDENTNERSDFAS
jgi:tetratricopeptide (TPR) repeat protein